MPEKFKVELKPRGVIERKMLDALTDDSVVFAILSKQDLEDLLAVFPGEPRPADGVEWVKRINNLKDGLQRLLKEAFPEK